MSTPVSEQDQVIFDGIGWYFVMNTVGVICETGFWAIYLVLFSFALKIQISRGLRNPPSIIILFVTIILFLSSTALWSMNVSQLSMALKGFFLKYPSLGVYDRVIQLNSEIVVFGLPMETLFLSNMIIGDAVVIWRAWALCKDTPLRPLVYIPMAMLSVSFAFAVISLDCLATNGYGFSQSTIPEGSKVCQWGEPIAWGISLLTNVVSTSLIAVRAWQHRRFLREGNPRLHSKSQRILVVLVESGFVYCLFWLSQLILFFDFEGFGFATYLYMFLSTMGDQISGVYPTMIIILVYMQRSISDSTTTGKITHGSSLPPSTTSPASQTTPSSAPPSSTESPPPPPASPPPPSDTATSSNTETSRNGRSGSGTPTQSSTESTVTSAITTVVQTTVVVTLDGQQFTIAIQTDSTIAPGTVITSPASTGGVVGGIADLAILFTLLVWCYKRYRFRKAIEEFNGNFDPDRVVTSQRPTSGVLTSSGGHGGRRGDGGSSAPTLPQIPVEEEDDDGMGGRLNGAAVEADNDTHHTLRKTQFPNPYPPTTATTSEGSHYTGYGGLAPGQDWRHPSPGPSLPNTAPSVGSSSHPGGGGVGGGMSAARLAEEREAFGGYHPNQPSPYNQPPSSYNNNPPGGRRMSASSNNTNSNVFYSTTSEGSGSHSQQQHPHGRLAVANPDAEFEEQHRAYLAEGPLVHRDAGPARDEIPPMYESLLPSGAGGEGPRPLEKVPSPRQVEEGGCWGE
ncbi:hypothetical protein Moror_11704 [Moniliophthora roreri MCA 2997]|uniref:Uncharacterized protein n=1 Tax=Moniliophthora roreri (strain MCA 2997) TaxID=1381753 RepID=V2X4I0_MONRO|nr:hypothetical protein Moror_11704 [Moniliophthora roreri MCA 2997]